jgi:hypothetical protein
MCWPVCSDEIPLMVNHQGVIKKDGVPLMSGLYEFRFAIIDDTTTILWSNDGTNIGSSADSVSPTSPVTLQVTGGRYNVKLGDTSLTNMVNIETDVFSNQGPTYLRIWFNKTGNPEELFQPDVQLVSVPYSYLSHETETVQQGAISTEHSGRSNQVKSIFFKDNVGQANEAIFTVPADKTFVITDYLVCYSDNGVEWGFRNNNTLELADLVLKIDTRDGQMYNYHVGFQAGIVLQPGETLYVRREVQTFTGRLEIVFSGYEY